MECLKSHHKIDGLVLLNASLSPKYDLSNALGHTRRGIVNIYSQRDWFMLGIGTSFYGTMDGKHEASAGMIGFIIPPGMPEAYVRFFQMGWNQEMANVGHRGGHFSSSASKFVARYVAPLVRNPKWSPELIDNIMFGLSDEIFDSPTNAPVERRVPSIQPVSDSETNPGIQAVPMKQSDE